MTVCVSTLLLALTQLLVLAHHLHYPHYDPPAKPRPQVNIFSVTHAPLEQRAQVVECIGLLTWLTTLPSLSLGGESCFGPFTN